MRLVRLCARGFRSYWDHSDMLSAGLVGYATALKKWRPGPVPFDAFAIPTVRRAMIDAYREWNGRGCRPVRVPLESAKMIDYRTPETILLTAETKQRQDWALRQALTDLPVGGSDGRIWRIMMRHLYASHRGTATFAAIGRRRRMTESNANRLYMKGLALVKARMEELLA